MKTRYIPENVLSGKRIFGFKKRNLTEGIIEILIMMALINKIPFVPKVKWIVIGCLAVAILAVNYLGIAGNSLIQTLYNFMQYRYYLKPFSFRRIQNGKTENKPIIVNGKVRTIRENRGTNTIKKIIGK